MTNHGADCVLSLRAFIPVFLLSVVASGAPVAAELAILGNPDLPAKRSNGVIRLRPASRGFR